MNKPPLPTVAYRRSFVVLLFVAGACLALTLPDIDGGARDGMLLVLSVTFIAALGLGVVDSAPIGVTASPSDHRRRLSYVFGGVMAATLLAALVTGADLPRKSAFGSWCGSAALGMSMSVAYRLLRGVSG